MVEIRGVDFLILKNSTNQASEIEQLDQPLMGHSCKV